MSKPKTLDTQHKTPRGIGMEKTHSLAFIALLLFALAAPIASAAAKPNIVVSGFSVPEGAIEVGKEFTLAVTLANLEASSCGESVTATAQAAFPFIMEGVTKASAGDVCTGSPQTVRFHMRVDPTATGGSYPLGIRTDYQTFTLAQFSSTDTITVFVSGTPQLSATIVDSSPVDIYPGDSAAIAVNIQNDGGFEAQSVTTTLQAADPVEVKWAKSSAAVGTLGAKQGKTVSFAVELPKDAPAMDYPLSLRIAYRDESLTLRETAVPLVLQVRPKALFTASDAGSDVLYANTNSKRVRLSLKNTGTDTAYRLKVTILPQYPITTDASVKYIEQLAPGKSAPVEFTIDVDKDGTPATYGLDLLVQYEDGQGKKMQDTAIVALTVKEEGALRAIFLNYWFLWVAAIALALFLYLKRRPKAGKRKEKA